MRPPIGVLSGDARINLRPKAVPDEGDAGLALVNPALQVIQRKAGAILERDAVRTSHPLQLAKAYVLAWRRAGGAQQPIDAGLLVIEA